MNYLFSTLDIQFDLVESLSKLGIVRPSNTQYKFIKSFTDESSIIFQSKSGTGKTVGFCISLLHKIIKRRYQETQPNISISSHLAHCVSRLDHLLGDAVIIVPTRELAYQIYLFFVSLKRFLPIIKSILLIGNTDILKCVTYMKKENVNIVVSTPGRFGTVLKSKPAKNEIVKYGYKTNRTFFKTHTLIFDEADLLFDEQFYEQTKYICGKLSNPFVQIIAVSATFIKPQLKVFEDMICEVDRNYITNFVKRNSTITEDTLGRDGSLTYNTYHLLMSKKIEKVEELLEYVSGYERVFERMFLSSSYVKGRIHKITKTSDDEENQSIVDDSGSNINMDVNVDYSIGDDNYVGASNVGVGNLGYFANDGASSDDLLENTDNDIGTVSDGEDESSQTLVIEKVKFYYAVVEDAPNIVMQIGHKIKVLVGILESLKYKKCIIFSNQSHTRAQVYGILKYLGCTCYMVTSRMSHNERVMMLYDLNSVEKVIIVCTDVMSRGIGLANVDLVINMDMPGSKEIFLHRSGRSGRFGAKGVCVSICMESEVETYNYFLFALNFKSESIKELYNEDGSVEGRVPEVVMKTIDFVKLNDELPDIKNITRQSVSSSLLDTEEFKFNVSIVGFISDTDMTLINTHRAQVLMYIESTDNETAVTIKHPGEKEALFESFTYKLEIIYSDADMKASNDIKNNNSNFELRHIVLKTDHSQVLVSLPLVEFKKLLNSGHNQLELLKEKISQLLESKCSLNYYDFRAMLSGRNDDNINDSDDRLSDFENQLVKSLDSLSIRNHEIVMHFTDHANGRFHDLVKLYISSTETITTFNESTVKEIHKRVSFNE
ncbi:uncharacterized protein TOT_040000199 [Theileria orientalis strain Shintoku]|uniref:ATP-dependent RNA helicase n=1 Tax=Theileria orientalis strain Shintoku TaxID=869250 RepID=J4C929_THEOR|nr:uncharacterized protein TOT_040000199 [Theileria orientalis strain Shintoku]BAM41818.1 uncharacterized protein TOT_040000199 [Theileria orientalis strain Shintoku]|eukprot:XP_009692119.1 uncharacterized protein TOT_040000199 [Theileria orientalis strain Shintoku]